MNRKGTFNKIGLYILSLMMLFVFYYNFKCKTTNLLWVKLRIHRVLSVNNNQYYPSNLYSIHRILTLFLSTL